MLLSSTGIGGLESVKCLVEGEDVMGRSLDRGLNLVGVHSLEIAAVLPSRLSAGLIDQDLAHGLCCRGKEMPPPIPSGILIPDETQVRLVDESCGLQRIPRRHLGHECVGEVAKLGVQKWQELGGSPQFPPFNGSQNPCNRSGSCLAHPVSLHQP